MIWLLFLWHSVFGLYFSQPFTHSHPVGLVSIILPICCTPDSIQLLYLCVFESWLSNCLTKHEHIKMTKSFSRHHFSFDSNGFCWHNCVYFYSFQTMFIFSNRKNNKFRFCKTDRLMSNIKLTSKASAVRVARSDFGESNGSFEMPKIWAEKTRIFGHFSIPNSNLCPKTNSNPE